MNIKKTADLLINFAIKRLAEILGLIIFIAGIMLLLALASYSPEDPNFIFPDGTKIKNLLGFNGSFISDLFFQSIGLIAYLLSFTFIITGFNIFKGKEFFLIIENIFFGILYSVFGSLFLTYFYMFLFLFPLTFLNQHDIKLFGNKGTPLSNLFCEVQVSVDIHAPLLNPYLLFSF